jgi:hypothetical protein
MVLGSCSPEGTNKCYIQVLYNSSTTDPYAIDQLSVKIIEKQLFGKTLIELTSFEHYSDDQSDIYFTELSTAACCNADIQLLFSEPENPIVSGSFSLPLKPDVLWQINMYPYRPPFFYICYSNIVLPVDEEDRVTYGDSMYVKWDMCEIE